MVIDVRDLVIKYGATTALDGVSFSVKRGEIFGFLGPNGAGKTTMVKVLTTLLPPTSGEARVLGYDAKREASAIRRRIGLVQQQPSFELFMTVEQNLRTHGMLWNLKKNEIESRLVFVADLFDLKELLKTKSQELSIGQRRRMQVAREFMHDMDVLFLDEPTTGIDPKARRVILDYLKERAKNGLTIFFTTHIMEEAEYLCDRIAVVNKGHILACEPVQVLMEKHGAGSLIEISAKDINDAVLESMRALSGVKKVTPPGQPEGPMTVLVDTPSSILPVLLDALARRGCAVTGVNVKVPSLEDVFIGMISE